MTNQKVISIRNKIKFDVQDLDFYYQDVLALQKMNMNIYQNEITALIGPSGCGKRTISQDVLDNCSLHGLNFGLTQTIFTEERIMI